MLSEALGLRLTETSRPYQKTIFDVIRIFVPQFIWATPSEEALDIQVLDEPNQMTLVIGEEATELEVAGMDPNERRRALKWAVYHYVKETLGQEDPGWGILTGIRPTKIVHRMWDAGLGEEAIAGQLATEYILAPEKIKLLLTTTKAQRPFLLSREVAKQAVSIYISIPFCPTRCAYCSFPSFSLPKPQLLGHYLDNLSREIEAVSQALEARGQWVQTVYIGGGTPTTLSSAQLELLLGVIQENFGKNGLAEFTVEAGRPDTIDREKLLVLKARGVDRISINPQTMWAPTLAVIGRQHSVQAIIDAYYLAKEVGIPSINMDLIIGLPGEEVSHFQHTLRGIGELKPENLTVHTLAIKRTARLNGQMALFAHEDVAQAMNQALQAWLEETGAYQPYYLYRQKQMVANLENVGYTLPGHESLYNIQMMEERQTIYGLGVGSASKFVHPEDWTLDNSFNPKDLLVYNERIQEIITKKVDKIASLG